MRQALEQAATQLIPPLVLALSGLLCALVAYASSYFKSKTKNVKVQDAIGRLDSVMEDAVRSAQQSVVSAIKPGDDLSQVLANAKTAALDSVKSHYGPQGITELKKVLGWDDTLLAKNLDTKLESKVHDLKLERSLTSDTASNTIPPTT